MNTIERQMVEILVDLKTRHHVIGVKAEFEAEGTRLEEAMRLKEVISAAQLGLTLKIGGCEAIRDMYEARILGVSRIVAPMVETPYALKNFLLQLSSHFQRMREARLSLRLILKRLPHGKTSMRCWPYLKLRN